MKYIFIGTYAFVRGELVKPKLYLIKDYKNITIVWKYVCIIYRIILTTLD